jgi:ATP-dependent Lon protease
MFRENIDSTDWQSFWDERSRLFPEFAQMTPSSTYKVSQVAFKVLADAGYIETTRNKKLQNVYLLPEVRACLTYALEVRRRVKEQLKKIGGMEFFDVNFSYIDNETLEEFFVNVPEQGGTNLIPAGIAKSGVVHFVSPGSGNKLGVYRLESQMTAGNGKHSTSGLGSDTPAKEQVRVGFEYFKGNLNRIAATSRFSEHEFHLHFVDLQSSGNSRSASLSSLVSCCSILMNKPVQEQMVVLGSMTLGGVVNPVQDLASSMQVALEAGATKVLLPMASATDIPTVPAETFTKFQVSFYSDPVDAVYKALGVQ